MLTPSKRKTGQKTKRSAQAHLIYTSNDVLELFEIAPNTLTAWKKLGLPFVRSTSDLYLGQDLNRFLKWNKQRRRIPLEKTEVYCVHCKQKHSLHDHGYNVRHSETGSNHLALTCPVTGNEAHRFVSATELRLINREYNHNNRTDQDDYNVAQIGSKTAISSSPKSMIINSANLILRYEYQLYLKEVFGFATKTILATLRHITQFDDHLQHVDYKTVHRDDIIAYKAKIEAGLSAMNQEQRSASTIVHSLINLKKFFQWLELKTDVKLSSAGLGEYFSPSRELSALASISTTERFVPSLEQLRDLISAMPHESFFQKRDRAILAFLTLSGVRISALLSLQIQHIDVENRSIFQDARMVQTKNKKTMRTKWFPVGDYIEAIVKGWIIELRAKGSHSTDPLFPRALDPIRRLHEKNYTAPLMDQGTVRQIIKRGCQAISIPSFNPHAIRATLALHGQELCRNPKQIKAWSQNLGHENVATTDNYYAKLDVNEQFTVLDNLRATSASTEMQNLMHLLPSLPPDQVLLLANVAKGFVQNG